VTFRLSVVVLVATLAWVAPASAISLTPTPSPLPGSTVQGGDGNQANNSGFIDWQQLQADQRVVHMPDPEPPDSSFTGGSEENDPGGWGLTTGSLPDKANVLDVWSSVDQPDAATFLYLAFRREAITGNTHLAFELNRDPEPWNNGQAEIPCRRDGDLVVAYDVDNQDVDVTLQQWHTRTTGARGCAATGEFTDSNNFTSQDAQGAMSPRIIANYLTGGGSTLARGAFGEASLNLAQIAANAFGTSCLAFESVWMHTRSSQSVNSSMQDYVAPQRLSVRACSASGAKFFDSNGNGERDPGEPGIPRFLIWADYDNDGIHDAAEPFAVTDEHGRYVIYDIHGTYTLREMLLDGRTRQLPFTDWTCSFPLTTAPGGRFACAWGPINASTTPNATHRDFGNLYPILLVIRKHVEPHDDAAEFQVNVTSRDGSITRTVTVSATRTATLELPPGVYDVAEAAPPGSDYTTTIACRNDEAHRGQRRRGTKFSSIDLVAGARASCALVNLRPTPPGTPAIALVKTGPATATAGTKLSYHLYVTNPGEVAFPATGVHVTDAVCDGAPKLVAKHGPSGGADASPDTLDPGSPSDTWIYTCSHATSSGGDSCKPASVTNTATVTGTTGTATVDDSDTILTALVCPPPGPTPPNPTPPEPQPIEPIQPDNPDGPVEPVGPTPPDAGEAGSATAKFRGATSGCIRTHVPRVDFTGTRIASVRVYVDGHPRRNLTMRTLQREVTPRVTLAPGRHRVTAHVIFEPGAGTPPLTLTGTVRICAARVLAPVFTG